MQYFIFPIILLIYFELLGRWIMMKFNRKPLEFSFVLGFAAVMAFMYLFMWPITALNQSYYLLSIVCLLFFILSVICLLKDYKKIDFKFNWKYWLLFGLLVGFEIVVSYHRTLGETHGFDTLYYLNMISFNIGNPELNSLHPHFGTYPNTDVQWITYVFQSFYYFIPVVITWFKHIFSVVGASFETLPAFAWGFQILLHAIFSATALNCVKEIGSKNKILNIAFVILCVLFLNNLYYNNVYGFIGNNYRMCFHALATIFLFRYFVSKDHVDLFLFFMVMIGMCGISSTGTFATVFILFGLFFALYGKEKNLLKYYAILLYIPIVNILVTKIGISVYLFVGVGIFCTVVYLLNDFILKIYANKYVRIGTLVLTLIIFLIGSYLVTGDVLSIKMFFDNYSEIADMSWDYFMFNDLRHWIFNLIVLVPLIYYVIKNPKHPFSIAIIVLVITFFNPLGSAFMNKINWVYYRAYDIFINQYTIMLFALYLIENINIKYISKVTTIFMLIGSIILSIVQIPRYYHESFIPDDDFNPIYKIENSELEVIFNVRNMVNDLNIDNPKIITSTFFMPSFIPNSTYLFGKEKRYNHHYYDDISYALYLIFFPVDGIYDNFRPTAKPDYKNTIKYLNECDYDILIVDNGLYYHDDELDTYKPITSLVEADGTYQKSEYSTARYAVYYLD